MKFKFIRTLKKTIILIHLVFISTLLISCKNENHKEDYKIKKAEENYASITNFLFFKKGMTYDETIRELKSRKISVNENPEDQKEGNFMWPTKEYFELLGGDCKIKMIQCFSLNILDNQIPYAHLYFVNNNLVRLYYYSEDSVINSPKSLKDLKLLREVFVGLKEKYGKPHSDEEKGKIDTTIIISEPVKGVPNPDNGLTYFYYDDNCNWKGNGNGINIELKYYESKLLPVNSDYSYPSPEQATQTEINVIFDPKTIEKVESRRRAIWENEWKKENEKKVKSKKNKLKEL